MAVELGAAMISVGLSTGSLAGDIRKAFGSAESEGDSAGKSAGKGFGAAFGVAAAALGALGIGSFFKSAVSGAADLEQSMGAVSSVFKGSAGQMQEWSQQAAVDVGLSANEFNELGTLIGSQLKNGGTAMDELAPKTKSLISTGADLASMFGGTTSEAVEALSSALKGERDPIERYGVSLNQAKIDAEAAALGFGKVNGAFEQSAQQAATLSLITKQTADATGNFGRETDTLAHKQQVLNAQLANGKARIGTELLPVVAAFTGLLSKALGPAINGTVAAIKTLVGGTRGLYDLMVKGDFTSAFATAFNVEEDSPLVGVLFTVRSYAVDVVNGFHAMFAAFKAGDGDITSSGFAGFMERVGMGAREVTGGIRAMFAAFKAGDGDVTSSGFAGAMERIGLTVREVFDRLKVSFSILAAGFRMPTEAAAAFGNNLNPLLMVGVKIRETFSALGTALAGIWSAIGPQVAALVPMLFELFAALSPTSLIFQALLPVLPQLASAIGGVLAMVLPLALSLTSALLPIITELVASVLPPLIDIFGNIVTSIVPLVGIIMGALIPIIQALLPIVVTVFSVVADVVTSAMKIVQGIIQVVTGVIKGDWAQVWNGIGNIFKGIWETIVSVVRGALQIVGQVVMAGISGLIGTVGRGLGEVTQFFQTLPARLVGALAGIGSTFVSVGRNMIQGLIDGAAGMVGNAVQAVKNVGGAMLDGIKGFLGIHSPSRVFKAQVGMMIGAGLIAGIAASESGVTSAVNSLVAIPQTSAFGAGSFTASSGVSAAAPAVAVYIGNEQLDTRMYRVADSAIASTDSNSRYMRTGRA